DTVGEWGKMVDAFGNSLGAGENGEPIYEVKETYRQFLNAAKEALDGFYLSFNPVGAQGIEQVNTSSSDVLYTEFWPWDYDRNGILYNTYQSLVTEVERTMEESKLYSVDGKGKSLVVKSYINYYKTTGTMNVPGVLLCDAVVYAAGGSRIEIGNGNHMLHVEYYPNDDIPMGEMLQEYMLQMGDFTVAYENLLRDGQFTTENRVEIVDYQVSRDGQSDTIWAYTRMDGTHEILHLINLLGTDNEWRDERGKRKLQHVWRN
ncbi:MAG: glycoside hydrolase family 66 protein, partial [Lachnospiraceae bacterium]|nr:glycoside hydrolase family 66 protein [Lachnospiraceae bacterium]